MIEHNPGPREPRSATRIQRRISFLRCPWKPGPQALSVVATVIAGIFACGFVRALELYVDPVSGVDAPDRGRAAQEPLKTLTFAFQQSSVEELTIYLSPGEYVGRNLSLDSGEEYPAPVQPGLCRLELIGPDPTEGAAALILTDPLGVFFDLGPGGGEPPEPDGEPAEEPHRGRFHFERLHFEGGYVGISVAGRPHRSLSLSVKSCVFRDQSANALEVYPDRTLETDLVVLDRCRFEHLGGGLQLEALEDSRVEVSVTDCRFVDIEGVGTEGFLGAGVQLHLDPRAELTGVVERSIFQDAASALTLTSSAVFLNGEDEAGAMAVTLASNLILSTQEGMDCASADEQDELGVRNALYLSVWPHHDISIDLVNNTLWGVERFVVYEDNHVEFSTLGAQINVYNNIIWDPFSGRVTFSQDRSFPPPRADLASNIVPEHWLRAGAGTGENWSFDPLFQSPTDCDFELRPLSAAIDRGDSLKGSDGALDLAGRCRRATLVAPPQGGPFPVDLGAYESDGYCEGEPLLVFRRGDCNLSANVDLADAIFLFSYLFVGGLRPDCKDACDSTDDGRLDLTDGIYTLSYLFSGGPPPAAPFPAAGFDRTRHDALGNCLALGGEQ